VRTMGKIGIYILDSLTNSLFRESLFNFIGNQRVMDDISEWIFWAD
jgi:hypothetical protein